MSKNAIAKKTNDINLEGATKLSALVSEGLDLANKGYISVAPHVAKLYDCHGYKALGYKNFDEMCFLEWGMSHGTSVGLKKVFELAGVVTKDNEYIIPDKYLEYGYTKLLRIAENKKQFKEANLDPFEVFTPDMSWREMADKLKATLEDKAKKQDENAIDTTEGATTEGATTEGATNEGATNEETSITPTARLNSIMSELLEIRKKLALKPEKDCLFDAIIANIKEVKKAIK